MEKQSSKSKSKILRLLPRAAQASVSFQSPPLSPARDKRLSRGNSQKIKSHLFRALSGPFISMIPSEESKNFEASQEPTSPKISCMGQIKHKKRVSNKPVQHSPTEFKPVLHSWPDKINRTLSAAEPKRILRGGVNGGKPPLPDRAPCLSQMMRTGSSRDKCAYLDYDFYSGEDWGSFYGGGDDAAVVTFSAPMTVDRAVLEPRKEINLWKRRTVTQLKPLQLI